MLFYVPNYVFNYFSYLIGNVLPRDLHSELGKVYSSAGELFRHFWSCFPPRTPQLKEKLHRMHTTLCKYHETTVREFQVCKVNNSCIIIKTNDEKNRILKYVQNINGDIPSQDQTFSPSVNQSSSSCKSHYRKM